MSTKRVDQDARVDLAEEAESDLDVQADTLQDPEADLEALYSADYLRDCADDEAREERLAELRRRIAAGAYNVDPDRIAEEILVRRNELD